MNLIKRNPRIKWLVPLFCFLVLLAWWVETPSGLLGKADAIGYAVCHRISIRSFHLDERPLPLCARCTGMYLGAVAGMLYQAFRFPRRGGMLTWKSGIPFILFVLAWVVDGANSFAHLVPGFTGLYPPGNTLRLMTGLGMGLSMAAILFPAFNQTVWRVYDSQAVFQNPRPYVEVILITIGVGILTLTGNPMILYPFAIISAAGVLMVLTTAYTLLWLMAFRRENTFDHWRQLLIPLSGGLATAIVQIAVVDLLRYSITGTWAGFHF